MESFVNFLEAFGYFGLIVHSFLDAIIFPIPAFFTQVSLSLVNPNQALLLATAGYIACLAGTPIGYFLGKLLGNKVLQRFLNPDKLQKAETLFRRNGEAAILIGSFTPIPFKIFTILSGSLHFSLWKLMLYASIGRAVKFYVVGLLFYFYGHHAEDIISSSFTYIMLGCSFILFIGVLIKRRLQRRKEKRRNVNRNVS
ncbi:YqaA family protein [Shouchella lonarensis]|uniref:Membrane protein YqaA, SNARE-associated domain n=1 Tax=Shouchella lonarensis TaxID=1464122 RepID=A0A1G6LHZ3_9BACI|nr:VTT domain-containing protein [Shouchella lonarensis]SDC42803.1 membrane protein YqaA, SNARE-associated domain [Shouchella lonarensis]